MVQPKVRRRHYNIDTNESNPLFELYVTIIVMSTLRAILVLKVINEYVLM